MRSHLFPVLAMFCVVVSFSMRAIAEVEFKDGEEHLINYGINTDVYVDYETPNNGTTVRLVSGGSINGSIGLGDKYITLNAYEDSTVYLSGGSIHGGATNGASLYTSLNAYDNSNVYFSSGSIGGGSTAGGGLVNNSLKTYGQSVAYFSGGSIGGGFTNIGASVNNSLEAHNNSVIHFSGGLISGGQPSTNNFVESYDNAVMYIYGSNFNYPLGAVQDSSGWLTGTLASGEGLNVSFLIAENASIVLVPEPGAFFLMSLASLGIVICSWRRRHGQGRAHSPSSPLRVRSAGTQSTLGDFSLHSA